MSMSSSLTSRPVLSDCCISSICLSWLEIYSCISVIPLRYDDAFKSLQKRFSRQLIRYSRVRSSTPLCNCNLDMTICIIYPRPSILLISSCNWSFLIKRLVNKAIDRQNCWLSLMKLWWINWLKVSSLSLLWASSMIGPITSFSYVCFRSELWSLSII